MRTALVIPALVILQPLRVKCAQPAPARPSRNPIVVLDRFIAIDNACAWPRLTVLPNGEIAALIWPYPNHGLGEGAVECWVSSDEGASWHKRGVPVPNVAGVARCNVAGGLTADGAYIAMVGGYAGKPRQGDVAHYHLPFPIPDAQDPVPALSFDYGRTWRPMGTLGLRDQNARHYVPFGSIGPAGGGQLGVVVYRNNAVFASAPTGGRAGADRAKFSPHPPALTAR